MNIDFITTYFVPLVAGICLCLGYIIKNIIPSDQVNKYIPAINAVVGVAMNIWINGAIDPAILLGGMFSGLAATGLYEMFKGIIEGGKNGK